MLYSSRYTRCVVDRRSDCTKVRCKERVFGGGRGTRHGRIYSRQMYDIAYMSPVQMRIGGLSLIFVQANNTCLGRIAPVAIQPARATLCSPTLDSSGLWALRLGANLPCLEACAVFPFDSIKQADKVAPLFIVRKMARTTPSFPPFARIYVLSLSR